MAENKCTHKWVLLETKKIYEYNGYAGDFKKIWTFYCEKCLEFKTVLKTGASSKEPEWY